MKNTKRNIRDALNKIRAKGRRVGQPQQTRHGRRRTNLSQETDCRARRGAFLPLDPADRTRLRLRQAAMDPERHRDALRLLCRELL